MSLITCRDLSLGYDGNPVVTGLNFEVNTGDYLCIVGENGAGKSTLMKTILGLKSPLSGTIEFGDGLNKNEIGYLPQQTLVQKDFPASVNEIVLSGCVGKKIFASSKNEKSAGKSKERVRVSDRIKILRKKLSDKQQRKELFAKAAHTTQQVLLFPFYTREDKELARQNMERMGITNLKKRCYRELSGGQQQRVLLARALCATKKMLLLDEPVSGLDPKVTAQMYDLISQLNHEGITVIMISHDIHAAVKYASTILQISSSSPFFGSKTDYLSSEVNMLGGEDI